MSSAFSGNKSIFPTAGFNGIPCCSCTCLYCSYIFFDVSLSGELIGPSSTYLFFSIASLHISDSAAGTKNFLSPMTTAVVDWLKPNKYTLASKYMYLSMVPSGFIKGATEQHTLPLSSLRDNLEKHFETSVVNCDSNKSPLTHTWMAEFRVALGPGKIIL